MVSLYATLAIIPDFDLTVSIKKFWIARRLFDEKWRGFARDAPVGGSGLHRISGSSYATESKNVRNQTPLCAL
jgi:hypothetical protein